MVPLRQTMFSSGASYVRAFESTDTYSVIYNGVYSEITAGAATAYVGDKKVSLPAPAFENSDIVNDEVFVPLEFAAAVLSDKNVIWDETEKTLYINSIAEEAGGQTTAERSLIAAIEFDSH